ncbi:hypothetical protein ACFTAO_28230 [Paenibacillus rhizoplanae]
MTGGGPGDSTNTMIRYIYVTGFKKRICSAWLQRSPWCSASSCC